MIRRKIAAFANGWSDSYLTTVVRGLEKCAKEKNVDVFIFTDFSCGVDEKDIRGELNIQELPDLKEFDGVIMMSNTFNFQHAIADLKKRVDESGVPAVTLEYEIEGMDFYGTENSSGMLELMDHMLEVHEVKDVVVITGHVDNKESMERLEAVKTSMKNHGVSLKDENILVGGFSDVTAMKEFEEWYKRNGQLPDAIICANDIMALGIINYIDSIGFSAPKDVLITGYDHIDAGINCTPAITTVGRDWTTLGYNAMCHLLDRMDGKPVQSRNMMKSHLVIAESCGCHGFVNREAGIQNSGYGKKKNSMDFDSHNRAMYLFLRDAKNRDDVYSAFSGFLEGNNMFEGKTCCVCLTEDFFSKIEKGTMTTHGYGEQVYVVANRKEGKNEPFSVINPKRVIPWDNSDETEGHFYIVVPLHSDEQCMGYTVFEDNMKVCDNYILYTWTRHINQYLEQVRTNMRLEQLNDQLRILSVTDALTGIYNRMGYKEFAIPYLEENREKGKNTVLMIADINRMKQINDQFGHAQGDLAIMVVAKALKEALPGWILVRYGGDEFLMVGDCDTKEQAAKIKKKIEAMLEREKAETNVQFPLSVSVGAVIIEHSSTLDVEECFQKADRSMYRIKKQHHKKADGKTEH